MQTALQTGQIGQAIKEHRVARGLTLMQLESVTGIHNSSLSRIENEEQSLTNETMLKLAAAFTVSLGELFSNVATIDAAEAITIPTFGITSAGELVIDESKREAFLLADLQRAGQQPRAFVLADDTMAPKLNHGDVVAVDAIDRAVPYTGGTFLLKMGGGLTIRKLFPAPHGGMTIQPANPQYPSITLGFADAERIQIVGRIKVARGISGF